MPELGESIRGSRAGAPGLAGLRLSRLPMLPLPAAAQHAPSTLRTQLATFCSAQPAKLREFEARAESSMTKRRRGAEAVADLVQGLSPAARAEMVQSAAQEAWQAVSLEPQPEELDEDDSSSEDEDSTEGQGHGGSVAAGYND